MSNLKVCFIILFALVFFSLTSCNKASEETLPIYNPSDFDPVLVDRSFRDINKNHKVSDFSLINQSGDIITQKEYENKIYVVDFFFTRCQTICPIMTNNMAKIQKEFINNSDVMLLSLSVTPDIDSVSVLQKYAMDKGVNASKWNITTGDKKHIYNLARKSYFAAVEQGDGDLQDFIHTSNFILVDKERHIRGIYDGTDDEELVRIIEDIKVLMN